jgi:hypothetical protein
VVALQRELDLKSLGHLKVAKFWVFLQAIANLSVNAEVAKTVATEGGISILASLARSPNRWVAEEAAGGLWNLSVGEDHKVCS